MKAVIYKICCKDTIIRDCYVGETKDIEKSKKRHYLEYKNVCDLKVYKFIKDNGGWDNWYFDIIEEFEASSRRFILDRQKHYIEILNSTLNNANYTKVTTNNKRNNKMNNSIERRKNWLEKKQEL